MRGALAVRFVGCFFLLFWAEIVSVFVNSKIILECSIVILLGINFCLSIGSIYLSSFALKVFSSVRKVSESAWIKMLVLSGVEAVVLLYLQTFIAIRQQEGVFVWLAYSDYLPNISVVIVLTCFFGWVLPNAHRAISQLSENRNREERGYNYSRVYLALAILLVSITMLLVNIFKLQPQPVWWLMLSEERQVLWRYIVNCFLVEENIYVFVVTICIAMVWLKKQISRTARFGKENIIIKVATALLLAISIHVFLGTWLYSALVSTARARHYDISLTMPYFPADINPTFLAYLWILGILVLLNYYFEKQAK